MSHLMKSPEDHRLDLRQGESVNIGCGTLHPVGELHWNGEKVKM